MQKLLLVLLLMPALCNAQKTNMITAWYGNQNSVLLEYSRHSEVGFFQKYGPDIGFGYSFDHGQVQTSLGIHGISGYLEYKWIYKMGVVLYDLEYYDVFIGNGIERRNMHTIIKFNILSIIGRDLKESRWVEFGIGFSF